MWRKIYSSWVFVLLLTCLAFWLKADEPATYISKRACPFECCAYGTWTVVNDVKVYERPSFTAPVLGLLTGGGNVEVTTGEVHVTPGRARIIGKPHRSAASFDPNREIEILDYIGEGYSRVRQGDTTHNVKIARTKKRCAEQPNWRYCWVEVLQEPLTRWWVRLSSNSEFPDGWVNMEGGDLRAIDECG